MKSLISKIRWLFKPQDKRKFIFIAVLMAFSALLELAGIGVLLGAATLFLAPESNAGKEFADLAFRIIPDISPDLAAGCAIAAIGILLAAKNIFAYLIVNIQSNFIFSKRNELAHRIFKRFLHADFESFNALSQDYCFGSFIRLNDVGNLILLPSMQLLADIMVIMILAAASVALFPAITLSGIAFMLIITGLTQFFTKRANRKNGEQFLLSSLKENRMRLAGIAGAKAVKCAAKEEFFQEKFDESYAEMSYYSSKLYTLGQLPRLVLESAAILLASGAFAIMLLLDIPKSEILLTFAVLTAAIGRILPALSRCHYNLTLVRQNMPQLDLVISILQTLPQEPEKTGKCADASQEIIFDNVTFAYKGKEAVLENFNLNIPPCSSLAIAGRSGRGKSTLTDILLGFLNPQSGKVTAGGEEIYSDLAGWRKQFGIVPQNIFLLEGTVAENVAFGEENPDLENVKAALKLAGLENFSPDTELTAAGNLSGGQRQRIGIARALYKNVKVLILDEATSALDAETENAFCDVLASLKGKVTLIVISHRESTLASCDRLLNL